jgi:hypothetical protein
MGFRCEALPCPSDSDWLLSGKPSFTQGLKDVSVLENENLDMKIILKGTPIPSLTMYHNGNEVSADARIKITKESTETYHMTFNVVLPSDGGDWVIKAENECGEVESRCKITVEGRFRLLFKFSTEYV